MACFKKTRRGKSWWTKRRQRMDNVEQHMEDLFDKNSQDAELLFEWDNEGDETGCDVLNDAFVEQLSDLSPEPVSLESADTGCSELEFDISGGGGINQLPDGSGLIMDELETDFQEFVTLCDHLDDCDQVDDTEAVDELVDDGTQSSSLRERLAAWSTSHTMTRSSMNELLSILRESNPELPKDYRTLIRTGKTHNVRQIQGGLYHHFGLVEALQDVLGSFSESHFADTDTVLIQINVDGLPLFNSSVSQLWPILGRVVEPVRTDTFEIGIFCGKQKPQNIHEYLHDFVRDLVHLKDHQVEVEGFSRPLHVRVQCFICDTPARAFVKQSKYPSGYQGCDKCAQVGVWSGKMTFPELGPKMASAPGEAPAAVGLRTDQDFAHQAVPRHHNGVSPLTDIPIGMVSMFPLDYMHLVCLGVMRRLLWMWTRGPLGPVRVSAQSVSRVSQMLSGVCSQNLPCEFSRKCRRLEEMERWKATEFRQFLLYSGVVCMKDVLQDEVYNHFLLLFVGIYCLASPLLVSSHCELAEDLLHAFVGQAGQIYGRGIFVYNIHGLSHLAADAKKFGALDDFSAFPYESHLGRIKRLVHSGRLPLQQVVKRLHERRAFSKESLAEKEFDGPKKQHFNGPVPLHVAQSTQFQQMRIKGVLLALRRADNCFMLDCFQAPVIVDNILSHQNDTLLVVRCFSRAADFFQYPVPSSSLGIVVVERLCDQHQVVSVQHVVCKVVLFPHGNKFVAIPLAHSV